MPHSVAHLTADGSSCARLNSSAASLQLHLRVCWAASLAPAAPLDAQNMPSGVCGCAGSVNWWSEHALSCTCTEPRQESGGRGRVQHSAEAGQAAASAAGWGIGGRSFGGWAAPCGGRPLTYRPSAGSRRNGRWVRNAQCLPAGACCASLAAQDWPCAHGAASGAPCWLPRCLLRADVEISQAVANVGVARLAQARRQRVKRAGGARRLVDVVAGHAGRCRRRGGMARTARVWS